MDPDQFRALPSGGTMLDDNTELHVALADDRDAAAEAALFADLVDSDRRLRVVAVRVEEPSAEVERRVLAAVGTEGA